MLLKPGTATVGQRLLCGTVMLIVCGLCGTFDILNNNFARWVARVSSFPEEEEFHSKDRSALVAAAHPSRRGSLRPRVPAPAAKSAVCRNSTAPSSKITSRSSAAQVRTGAGIYQHC